MWTSTVTTTSSCLFANMFVISTCYVIQLFGFGQTWAEGLGKWNTSRSPSAGLQRDPSYLERFFELPIFDVNLTQGFWMLKTLDEKIHLASPLWFAFVMCMQVTNKTWAVIRQVVLVRLAPGYVSQAVVGSTEERNAVWIEPCMTTRRTAV